MNRFIKIFAVVALTASPVLSAYADDPVVAASKAYVDSGLIQKASTASVLAIWTALGQSDGFASLGSDGKVPKAQLPSDIGVQADWDAVSGAAEILNKPTLGTAALSAASDFIAASQKGANSGVASLGSDGTVPKSQLPSDIGVQADWNAVSSAAEILNKPNLGTAALAATSDFIAASQKGANSGVASLGSDGKVPSSQLPAQAQADWTQGNSSAVDFIKNKPSLSTVATSGSYADLSNKPSFAVVATTGDYDDLVNQPQIPTLTGYATQSWVLSQGFSTGGGGGPIGDDVIEGLQTALLTHTQDMLNPHQTTKAQVGLGNVVNVDQTNAANITSGTVAYARLPVGNAVNTVAAGNDPRFAQIANKVDISALGTAAYENIAFFATAAQGLLAESATQAFSNSGSGNVVTSVAKNPSTNNVTVTYGTMATPGDITTLSNRLDSLENLGNFLGSTATRAALPTTVASAQSLWGITRVPSVGDYADILVDETHDGDNDSYRIIDVTGGVITWSNTPFRVYASDTTGFMDKVPGATTGNIGMFNSSGQMVDSGAAASDLLTSTQKTNLVSHLTDTGNPHSVTKAQVGLGNVANVDQQNANNITSGTVAYARLPVGNAVSTIAAGNDTRFDTIPTTAPQGSPAVGRALIWIE
ncbi:MAG: hypothetical protein FWE50_00055 [Alphaproteobacteria bacterium]|nr:hypothetical protein [Alphaproteobacteria bacterium]